MSQVVLPYFAPGNRLAGAVDYVDVPYGIRGWLVDVDAIGTPLSLTVSLNGEQLAKTVAVLDRPDIDKVLKTTTQCGFLIGWSRFDKDKLAEVVKTSPDAELEVQAADARAAVPIVCSPLKAIEILRMIVGAPQGDLKPPFKELNEYLAIAASGLFDQDWVTRQSEPDGVATPGILRYIRTGETAGFLPNLYFNPLVYATNAELPRSAGSLVHYIRRGEQAGIEPSIHFDPRWYASRYGLAKSTSPLAHYLLNRDRTSPNRWFDLDFYRAISGAPPRTQDFYEHFLLRGLAADLPPSPSFIGDGRSKTMVPPNAEAAEFIDELRRDAASILARFTTPVDHVAMADGAADQARPPAATPSADLLGPAAAILGKSYAETEDYLQQRSQTDLLRLVDAGDKLLFVGSTLGTDVALVLAIAFQLLGNALASARAQKTYLLGMSDIPSSARDSEIRTKFLALNHLLYQKDRSEEAKGVYELLYERGNRDYLTTLRLLEYALSHHDEPSATRYVSALRRDFAANTSVWGQISISRYHQLFGSRATGLRTLNAIPKYPNIDLVAETMVINRLIEMDAADEARQRLDALAADNAEVTWARFRVCVRLNDFETIADLLEHTHLDALPNWLLCEAMFQITKPGLPPSPLHQTIQEALYSKLSDRGLASQNVIQARLHYLLQEKRWAALKTLFNELETTEFAASRETQLKRLEYACYSGQAVLAEEIYRQSFAGGSLSKWESLTVLRLLAELKRWKEASEVTLSHVRSGYGFAGAAHMAIRVVRRGSLHEAIRDLVVRNELPQPAARDPDLADFLALVQEDHALVQSARAFTGGLTTNEPALRSRNSWLIPGSRGGAVQSTDLCTFLCTNQRYFLSLLTFLCSYLGQSPQADARLVVFLDNDVPKHWYGSISMVGARFNQAIDIVTEREFMPDAIEHRTEYGFFTGGSNLARAAYFRIYAARYLNRSFDFARVLYIDSDIVCRGDLSDLFRFDLDDKMIAARVEDYTLDVKNAAESNALDPYGYFNSGVLLLRFDDQRIGGLLDEAIRLSEEQPERLVFHDQCALNIAFKDENQPLPAPFNFYLRPHLKRNGFIEDGLLLHYLDRPKPWDLVFDRSYREEWRVWALLLSSIIPQNLYIDIFAAANRD